MPGRMVEDNSVQCIPVSKTRLVNQIDYLDDMVNPDAPGTTGPVVSFQSPGNATITYPTNIDNDIYVLAEPNPLDGTNMDVFADLLVLPSGAVGLTIDTRVEEDNTPIYNAGATPGGSGTTTIKLQRIVNGSVADDLTTVYVVGIDDAFLSAEDLNPGDSIRVSFQYQGVPANPAAPTPPNPPVTPPGAMIVIPRVIYSVITKAPQTYVAMSCDTDGNYTANYRYGFNGQQKDNEIAGVGNYLDFGMRMYDSRLAHFPTPDPLRHQFPSQSPYLFAFNSPIRYKDLEGMSAWDVHSKWSSTSPAQFGKYVANAGAINYQIKRTCEDLAIGLIVDYAKSQGLPLTLRGSNSFIPGSFRMSAQDDAVHNVAQFKNRAMQVFTAEGLRQSGIFTETGNTTHAAQRLGIKQGDVLFSMTQKKEGEASRAHHIMVVTERGQVTQDMLDKWQGQAGYDGNFKVGDEYAKIVQGNTGATSMFKRGEENPADDYAGTHPQTGTYNLSTDTFVRDWRQENAATTDFSGSESGNQNIGKLTGSGN
jgi:RHS repeat-associated protein